MERKSKLWNLWHGCHKLSAGCRHCYVYRGDAKRIDRLHESLPEDWGEGYENVTICCTIENRDCADYRLPIYKAAPIKHKILICEPLLERIDLRPYDIGSWVEQVVVGGESGYEARHFHFDWALEIRNICVENNVSFWFKQTRSKFVKDGRTYNIARQFQHSQARKAGINFCCLWLNTQN